MKDQADTQTAEIFPAPRRRGRPSSGSAKTNAQRQAEWRAKRKAELESLRNEKSRGDELPSVSDLVPELREPLSRKIAEGEVLTNELAEARQEIERLKAELEAVNQRNLELQMKADAEHARALNLQSLEAEIKRLEAELSEQRKANGGIEKAGHDREKQDRFAAQSL